MIEVWKDIPQYEGKYSVSNLGRIKSLDRFVERRGLWNIHVIEHIQKPIKTKYGYLQVVLRKNGKPKGLKVHRLVAIAFIPNPENKRTVNHKNGIKTDNTVENLEWMTDSENTIHSYKFLGRIHSRTGKFGAESKSAKPVVKCDKNWVEIQEYSCGTEAERVGGYSRNCISNCCIGKSETHKGFRWKFVIR